MEYFSAVDAQLGWIMERIDETDVLVCMSDHGMERIRTEVFLNTVLERAGYLHLAQGKQKKYTAITPQTKAFVLEPSRVYLNMEGSCPNGSVTQQQRGALIDELTTLFTSLEYNGMRVVRSVHTKEELYHGPCVSEAPDMVLVQEDGFSLRGSLGKEEVFGAPGMLTGMHRGSDAVLAVNRPETEVSPHVCTPATTEQIVPMVASLRST
jgi:predicted AlkP superfamily phosphohydrolase/phosphomutase